jgi:hypothetical protein
MGSKVRLTPPRNADSHLSGMTSGQHCA